MMILYNEYNKNPIRGVIMGIYLDYNSYSPIDERVLETMISVYRESYGNADSRTHDFGKKPEISLKIFEHILHRFLMLIKNEVFFTSGGIESNNIAIQGLGRS